MTTYNTEAITRVWQMATITQGFDPSYVRQDVCGALIEYENYGNRDSVFGWEIDHIIPSSKGGPNTYQNVQPLQWENNASKGDGLLVCSRNSSNQ